MDRLPLRRIAEVAFLAANFKECIDFYRKIGLELSPNAKRLTFGQVGTEMEYFGVCDEKIGFLDPFPDAKSQLHVAFEVPSEKLDECISFLEGKGIKTSPKYEWEDTFQGVPASAVYFLDPEGNVIELFAPRSNRHDSNAE